jgi:hypothetical protein
MPYATISSTRTIYRNGAAGFTAAHYRMVSPLAAISISIPYTSIAQIPSHFDF